MKKQIKLLVVFSLLIGGLASCLDENDPIWYFENEPAQVSFEGNIPKLKTYFGKFSLTSLSDTLKTGDYLWTNFIVDFGNQPNANDTLATNLYYKKIGTNTVKFASGDMNDDYADLIESSVLYNRNIGNMLFFGYAHKAPEEQRYDYELICNTDSINTTSDGQEVPTLYLRSKKTHEVSDSNTSVVHHFGFDMTEYINAYKKGDNTVVLYLKYLNSEKDGNAVYKSFQANPITFRF